MAKPRRVRCEILSIRNFSVLHLIRLVPRHLLLKEKEWWTIRKSPLQPTPPSDEGGGFLRSKKTEGEIHKSTQYQQIYAKILSLPQSPMVTAPSSDGAIFINSVIPANNNLPHIVPKILIYYILTKNSAQRIIPCAEQFYHFSFISYSPLSNSLTKSLLSVNFLLNQIPPLPKSSISW